MPSRQVWGQCKEVLKDKLNPHNYNSWIEPIECVSLSQSKLTLQVPSTFFIGWIVEHYQDSIIKIVEGFHGNQVNLNFVISKDQKDQKKQRAKTEKDKSKEKVAFLGKAKTNANLIEKYTFNNFVVGKSNEFCNAACRAVVNKLGSAYNPLFIFGGVGLGKTHLLHAIGHAVLEKDPSKNVLSLSSEKFVNSLINSLQRRSMASFRKKFRNLDVLLVDDIRFIGGKERTQEEFFHTFNTLFELKKQIVITSDKYPKDMHNLEERLKSRFAWGLIADIQPPELELKIAILKKLASQNGFKLEYDVAEYLASKIRSNIRELEGCLSRVMAYASLSNKKIDLEMAMETLKGIYDDTTRMIDIKQIQKAVCDFYKIRVSEMKSKSRSKNIAIPRHVAAYLSREYTNTSLPEIGRAFGGRDHTTIIHSVGKIKKDIEINTSLYNEIKEIRKVLDL